MIWWVITSNRKHSLCHCILFHFKHNGKMQYKSKTRQTGKHRLCLIVSVYKKSLVKGRICKYISFKSWKNDRENGIVFHGLFLSAYNFQKDVVLCNLLFWEFSFSDFGCDNASIYLDQATRILWTVCSHWRSPDHKYLFLKPFNYCSILHWSLPTSSLKASLNKLLP